jgi:hypothetical protein
MKDNPAKMADGSQATIPNGAAAAAILSAGAGCFLVSVFAWLGDAFPIVARFFNFYNPTGPLSGVTTTAIIVWLILWITLCKAWDGRSLPMKPIAIIAFLLLGMGFLLSFPPIGDFLQGK